jgi:DNA-binding NarL/FixJ family response regulator/thioredoxin-like negative regulator of GroEL
MQDYKQLSVLLIDPNPGMRASLHTMLTQASISKIEYAASAAAAIRHLSKRTFDIVLCEYDLAGDSGSQDGQDGQQLLEDLRHQKLIGLATIFIMLTSEGVYGKVMSAAELTPADYILKPFTADTLSKRISRAVERRAVFLPVYQLIARGETAEAIKACASTALAQPRHAAEFQRLRADLLLGERSAEGSDDGKAAEAAEIYRQCLENTPSSKGWARLGLGRALYALGNIEEAQSVLGELLVQQPRVMAAYDLLARIRVELDQLPEAKQLLEEAVSLSPHVVRRLRQLGTVAVQAGDAGVAERAYRQVLAKAKYSEFRDPEDHVSLVRVLVGKGDATAASNITRDLERSMKSGPETETCRAICSAMVMRMAGNEGGAAGQLTAAASAVGASKGLSPQLRLELMQNCLDNKLDQPASEVALALLNDADSGVTLDSAAALMAAAGRADLANGLDARVQEQVREQMDSAAGMSTQGEHRAAVILLTQALRKSPGNADLLLASATAILEQLNVLGWEGPLAAQFSQQLQAIQKTDAAHPALAGLRERFAATQRKYGIAVT